MPDLLDHPGAELTLEQLGPGEALVVGVDVVGMRLGVGELVGVEIKAGGFDGSDPDDLADLGDMIVAAYRDAKAQADAMAGEVLGPLAGGADLPGMPGQLGF